MKIILCRIVVYDSQLSFRIGLQKSDNIVKNRIINIQRNGFHGLSSPDKNVIRRLDRCFPGAKVQVCFFRIRQMIPEILQASNLIFSQQKVIIFVFKGFFKYYPLIDGECLENMLRYAIFRKIQSESCGLTY